MGFLLRSSKKPKEEIDHDQLLARSPSLEDSSGLWMLIDILHQGRFTTSSFAFINSLVSSGNVKIVVSSRPIPACVQAFSSRPKLQLQDLTRDDIKTYVDDTIRSHPHVQNLMTMEPQMLQKILEDLMNKASGVFLWVVLACRSLLEGFAAFDYPDELQ